MCNLRTSVSVSSLWGGGGGGLNHLFEVPKWSRNNFGKAHC